MLLCFNGLFCNIYILQQLSCFANLSQYLRHRVMFILHDSVTDVTFHNTLHHSFSSPFPLRGMVAPVQAWLTHMYMCIYAAHPHLQSRSKPETDWGWITESSSSTTPHCCSPGPWLVRNKLMKQTKPHILSKTFSSSHSQFPVRRKRCFFRWQQGPKPDTGLRTGCRQGCGPLHTRQRPLVQDTATPFLCLHP